MRENKKTVVHSSPVMSWFSKTEEKQSDNLPFEEGEKKVLAWVKKEIGAVGVCFLIVTMNFRSGKTVRKCPSHA